MSAAAAPDRLSDLSDDLLTRILSFVPTREAASTTALSRRWRRPLWLDTAAINLDYRSYTTTTGGGDPLRWRAMNDADHAFAFHCSHGCATKKLTMLMRDDATAHHEEQGEEAVVSEEEEYAGGIEEEEDGAGVEAAEEDARSGIQELRVEWLDNGCPCILMTHALSPRSLPFATLRVLDLTRCYLQRHSEQRRVPFPCLEALRLRRCRAKLATLQDMISAAPRLADVRLEALQFLDDHEVYRLRCPAATVIVMANCVDLLYHGSCSVKLDAPRLRRFRYEQVVGYFSHLTSFSLESPTTLPLDHVALALPFGPPPAVHLRHSLLSAVRHTRVLRLTAFSLADLDGGCLPMLFDRLECLEIQELSGWCILDHAAAATAVMDLLRSCPCLRELRLKLSWRQYIRETNLDPADEMAAIADFSPCRSMGGEGDEAGCCDDLEEELQGRCKVDCLRRVVVEFDAEELTCFQVRLLKFLARNAARTLEEVVVDGGKGYDSSCIDLKVAQWRRRKRRPRPPSPPPLSEFPPLEPPAPCSDGEVDDGDDAEALEVPPPPCSYRVDYDDGDDSEEDEAEDISPRYFMHSARKNKKGGSPECWSVKPKHKGLITGAAGWRRASGGVGGRRRRRRHCTRFRGEGDVTKAVSLTPVPSSATPATQSLSSLFNACRLRMLRGAPPPAPWRSLFQRRGTPRATLSRVPLITDVLCPGHTATICSPIVFECLEARR